MEMSAIPLLTKNDLITARVMTNQNHLMLPDACDCASLLTYIAALMIGYCELHTPC